jgi:hypothetical protein
VGRVFAILIVVGQIVTWGATAALIALDANEVRQLQAGGESLDWQWLALAAFVVFTALSAIEQFRLRRALNYRQRNLRTIEHLTHLATEGTDLSNMEGAGPMIWTVAGSPTQTEFLKKREDYNRALAEWSERVRNKIDGECPEFLADWDAANPADRQGLLVTIIKEIRSRLNGGDC